MMTNLTEVLVTALLAGIVGFILWFIQHLVANKREKERGRELLASRWGLALFELSEAISRSISYYELFMKGGISHGSLYFAESVASDYFKLNDNLTVAKEMNWMYAMLNQIQVNLHASKVTNEITRIKLGDTAEYAGAAAGFAKDHEENLISKFNFSLQERQKFCKEHKISLNTDINPLGDK
ncbi:MAG: hypothetical protein IIB00_09090 [candidate division Zixibacteria bacterium]|nr:hypothetical protein [candidate division Zixibacteria bacterium]